ncbi:hypothetical protein GCM10014715_29630 [Streptomyces spiralis]|uniref:Uncharacterized protein n=1 Tax=Streptomyces spiralis TaxID=66376 RepID=A0A919DSZ4_9ACTN|nr:hypothetical protein [Streptomyces spiralis]GHE73343.1 hypothetical protein GCM10014715_29630 [Streptomyces spiralis]
MFPKAVTGALSRAGSTLLSDRIQDSVTSRRSASTPTGLDPAAFIRGTQRDHSLSSLTLRRRRSLRCDMCSSLP